MEKINTQILITTQYYVIIVKDLEMVMNLF